jgi:hypothetical protein
MQLRIEKIGTGKGGDKALDALKRRGVTRLPALVSPSGEVFVGIKKITELLDSNLSQLRGGCIDRDNTELGTNPDLAEFWERELYEGTDNDGRRIARADADDEHDAVSTDIERKMNAYSRNVPAHRRGDNDASRGERTRPGRRRAQQADEDYDDNSRQQWQEDGHNQSTTGRRAQQPSRSSGGNSRDDDLDNQMLAAWMENNNIQD